jgi:eukaryotic-like serine/threonine-protein kinase
MQDRETYRFRSFRLDVREQLVFNAGDPVPLSPKAFETLLFLVRNPGRLLTKDELLQAIWPDSFVEENSLTQNIWILRRALLQNADEVLIETVPKRGYRFVADVLLEESPKPELPVAVAAPRVPWNWRLALAILSLAAAMLIGGYFVQHRAAASTRPRPSLAVLQFTNLSGDSGEAWLSTALLEMFSSELSAGAGLRLVPTSIVARLRAETSHSPAGLLEGDDLNRVRNSLTCDLLVSGSFLRHDGRIRVDVLLEDARTGELVDSVSATESEHDLLGLVSTVGEHLRNKLGITPVLAKQVQSVRASVPKNQEAARFYSEGLAHLQEFDPSAAQPLLSRAVLADPQFPLAHSALSTAWSLLGYDERAKAEAKRAFELSGSLARENRLLVEARYREAASEWPKAIEIYSALWTFFPDNAEYGIQLASAQTYAGQGQRALEVIESLRKLSSSAGDPRIAIAEATTAEALSDYRRGLASARQAIVFARGRGSRLLEAAGLIEAGKCLARLTQPGDAETALAEAHRICAEVGDDRCAAEALGREASIVRSQGNLDHAREILEQALAISRRTGDRRATAQSLTTLASILRSRADMAGAQQLFEEALNINQEIGDRRAATLSLINLGNVINNSGHPEEAKQRYRAALNLAKETGDRNELSIAMGNLAIMAYTEGDLGGARKGLYEVLEIKRQIGDRSSYAYSLGHMGNVMLLQGDIGGARKAWKEQCDIQSRAGEKIVLANCELGLAELDMYEGHPEGIAKVARRITSEFATVNPAADAWKLLAESSLRTGDLATAQEAAEKAKQFARKSPNAADYQIPIAITAAKVAAASGRTLQAVRDLNDALSKAATLHLAGVQFSARLAICEIQKNPQQIAMLEKDARETGFALIASQAAALRR